MGNLDFRHFLVQFSKGKDSVSGHWSWLGEVDGERRKCLSRFVCVFFNLKCQKNTFDKASIRYIHTYNVFTHSLICIYTCKPL